MMHEIVVEICCGSLSDVMTACRFPIDRIELNCALALGGLTPSISEFRLAEKQCGKPLMVMVRPREAGFVYSQSEIDTIFADAEAFLKEGAEGIVFGFLNPDHTIDEADAERMITLVHSYGKTAVFHRAVDETADYMQAVKTLVSLHCDRILTSGHEKDALHGAERIRQAQQQYGQQIEILAGSGITAGNVRALIEKTGIRQIHLSAKTCFHDQTDYPAVSGVNIDALLKQLGRMNRTFNREKEDEMPQADVEMLENDRYEDHMEGPLSEDER